MAMYSCKECLCSKCKRIKSNCAECLYSIEKTNKCLEENGIKKCRHFIEGEKK